VERAGLADQSRARNGAWRALQQKATICRVEPAHHGAGWPGNRSAECGRSHAAAHAAKSDARTHRQQRQEALLILVRGVSPAKRDRVIQKRNEAVIGDRHAMGVGAEVAKHLLGSAERWFAIDHPARNKKTALKASRLIGSSVRNTFSRTPSLPLLRTCKECRYPISSGANTRRAPSKWVISAEVGS